MLAFTVVWLVAFGVSKVPISNLINARVCYLSRAALAKQEASVVVWIKSGRTKEQKVIRFLYFICLVEKYLKTA